MVEDIGKTLVTKMKVMRAHVQEQFHDTLEQLALDNPEEAIKRFPEVLKQILDQNKGFFSGVGCGGPYPPAIIPTFNIIGGLYPDLPKPLREMALSNVLSFVDRQRSDVAQEYVAGIYEPWLVGDIIANRSFYWPGCEEYSNKLNGKILWSDLEESFVAATRPTKPLRSVDEEFFMKNVRNEFFLTYAASFKDVSPYIREHLSDNFPELVDRTKDAIAAIMAVFSMGSIATKNTTNSLSQEILRRSEIFAPEWQGDLLRKVNERKWILLKDRDCNEAFDYLNSLGKNPLYVDSNL